MPCGAVFTGGPDMEHGHFFHWNTVNEVVVTYGANQAMLAPGQIFVTQQLHGVNSSLRNEKDPEAFAVMVITQHQSTSGDQREAVLARCKKSRPSWCGTTTTPPRTGCRGTTRRATERTRTRSASSPRCSTR